MQIISTYSSRPSSNRCATRLAVGLTNAFGFGRCIDLSKADGFRDAVVNITLQKVKQRGHSTMQKSRSRKLLYLGLAICLPSFAMAGAPGGPGATTAKVNVTVNDKPLPLQRDEQIAFMFVVAMSDLENECTQHAGRGCTLDELAKGGVPS